MMVYFIVDSEEVFGFLVVHLEKASVFISSIVQRRIHVFDDRHRRVDPMINSIIMGFLYIFFFL